MKEISKDELMRGLLTEADLDNATGATGLASGTQSSPLSGLIPVYKEWGKTPLLTLDQLRQKYPILDGVPLSYAGRLDPLAEGLMLVLVGDANKDREKYLGLDKTYEVEILFGIQTDTGDLFGVPTVGDVRKDYLKDSVDKILGAVLESFVGKQQFSYPVYSSKTVQGKPLFQWMNEGRINEIEIPKTDIEIYSIEIIGNDDNSKVIGADILQKVHQAIKEVKGDFRYSEIREGWESVLNNRLSQEFYVCKIECKCSSGTYMRVLAEEIGKKNGLPSLAYSIKRTKVGEVGLTNAMYIV